MKIVTEPIRIASNSLNQTTENPIIKTSSSKLKWIKNLFTSTKNTSNENNSENSSNIGFQKNNIKNVSFFSNVNQSSNNQQDIVLTLEDFDEKVILEFKRNSYFVFSLLLFSLCFIIASFSFEKYLLMEECFLCKSFHISLMYLVFFSTGVLFIVTLRNINKTKKPKDLQNLLLVNNRNNIFLIYGLMVLLNFLQLQTTQMFCPSLSFLTNVTTLSSVIAQTFVLISHLRIESKIKDSNELSVKMESVSSEVNSKQNQIDFNDCINEINRRKSRNSRKQRKFAQTRRIFQRSKPKEITEKKNGINIEDQMERNLEAAREIFEQRQRNKEIRGIRISFGPKQNSIDSISTRESSDITSPFSSLEDKGQSIDAECPSFNNSSFDDSCDFEFEIEENCSKPLKNKSSLYETPTKRLDKQFRKICLSEDKNAL